MNAALLPAILHDRPVGRKTIDLRLKSWIGLCVKHTIAEAVEQVQPLMEKKRHHLAIELARDPAFVSGDQKRLVQVLANILNIAVKYTPEGGNIRLSMALDGNHVALCIADDGVGIDPELQPHIFELFAQAKRTSDRSQGGLGIGLALVKSLVELHGGGVTCISLGAGQGVNLL